MIYQIAGDREATVEDVLDGDPCGDTSPRQADDDEDDAVDSLP